MTKKSFEDELMYGMQRELRGHDKNQGMNNLVKAAEYLHSAMDILEEAGLSKSADQVLHILAKVAHGEGSEKIQKMIEETLEPMEFGGDEPLNPEDFEPISLQERLKMRELAPADDNDTASKKHKELEPGDEIEMKSLLNPPKEPEVFEFTSLMQPKQLPPSDDDLVFKSIAQELGLIDENDSKPRKPKDPTHVSDRHTKGLTSEKMVANMKNHGSWFNMADDGVVQLDDAEADDLLDLEISEKPIEVMEPSSGKTFED